MRNKLRFGAIQLGLVAVFATGDHVARLVALLGVHPIDAIEQNLAPPI
jgi:hypothetical protein